VTLIGLSAIPALLAQTGGAAPQSLAPLALRRWYASLTLCSPDATPSYYSLWAFLSGLAALLLIAAAFQGPATAIRQLLDVRGHAHLVSAALGRLRRAGRVVAVTVGLTVVAWSVGQFRTYNVTQGRDDVLLLTRSRSLVELAFEQGTLAGMTALRDLFGLAENLPLLLVATIAVVRLSAERWGAPYAPRAIATRRSTVWDNVFCVAGPLYLMYRLVGLTSGSGDFPIGVAVVVDVVLVPLMMLVLDGVLLAWVLVELRNASLGDRGNDEFDIEQPLGLMPAAALACLAALPSRYIATAVMLGSLYLPGTAGASPLIKYVRWELNWGVADFQAAALLTVGMAGAVAWGRGSLFGAVRGYLRLLRAEGGRLVAVLIVAGLAAGGSSGLSYLLVLALPAQNWVLAAADAYAHYASLPVGFVALAAMVELGERALPVARLVEEPAVATVA
jgi:hypothetical protein